MTTRKDEIDEELKSQAPPPEELEAAIEKVAGDAEAQPTKIEMMSAEQYVQQAQEPQLARLIDRSLNTIKETTGATWKQMLRGHAMVLRSIAVSMPWNEEDGLDARRFHSDARIMLPSWRDCIGALLHLEFSKPEEPTEAEEETKAEETQDDGA